MAKLTAFARFVQVRRLHQIANHAASTSFFGTGSNTAVQQDIKDFKESFPNEVPPNKAEIELMHRAIRASARELGVSVDGRVVKRVPRETVLARAQEIINKK